MGEMRLRCVVKRSTNAPGYTTNTNMPKPFTLTCSLPGAEKHDAVKEVGERDIKNVFSQSASYCWGPTRTRRVWFVFHNRVLREVKVN